MTRPIHEDRDQRPLTRQEALTICLVLFGPGILLGMLIVSLRFYEPPMPASCAGYLNSECAAVMEGR